MVERPGGTDDARGGLDLGYVCGGWGLGVGG